MKTDTPSARSSRRSAGTHSIINVILVLILLLMVNYLGFKYYRHVDLSASQFYTLSPKTIEELKKLDSPVTIYTYLDPQTDVLSQQVETLLKEYQQAGGSNIVVEKVSEDFNQKRAIELQQKLHLLPKEYAIIFEKKDRPLRTVKPEELYDVNQATMQPTDFKGEQLFTGAITALIEGKSSKVYFLQGHAEHSPLDLTSASGYGFLGEGLKGENIDFDVLNLSEKGDVPDDAEAVVIAGPETTLFPIEVEAIAKYLDKNGKLIIMLDPFYSSGLESVLAKYGIKFDDDEVYWRGTLAIGQITQASAVISPPGGYSQHPITAKFQYAMQIDHPRSITLLPAPDGESNQRTMFLLQTLPEQWGRSTKSPSVDDPTKLTFDKSKDFIGPLIIAAEYDGGTITDPNTKETGTGTRIVAIGSSNFLDNLNIGRSSGLGGDFFVNCLNWLVKKNPVYGISPEKPMEYGVSLGAMSLRTTYWFAVFVVPGCALAMGIFTWVSRRK